MLMYVHMFTSNTAYVSRDSVHRYGLFDEKKGRS